VVVDPLEADSFAVGDAWVEHVRRDLENASRRIAGGWPGTVGEARARTQAHFAQRRARSLSPDDLERVAVGAYRRARRQWLARTAR
jgi:hypothetical protein